MLLGSISKYKMDVHVHYFPLKCGGVSCLPANGATPVKLLKFESAVLEYMYLVTLHW